MLINLSPVQRTGELTVSVEGYKLTVCGEIFDFSELPRGYELSLSDIESPLFGDKATMGDNGVLEVTLILPYSNPNASRNVTFPEPIQVSDDGFVNIPRDESVPIEGPASED